MLFLGHCDINQIEMFRRTQSHFIKQAHLLQHLINLSMHRTKTIN